MKDRETQEPARRNQSTFGFDLDRPGWALSAYALVAYLVCFWRLGSTRLIQMEGMVADGARHMLESGDWFVPRVYGEIYSYKPALAYWFGSLSYRLADPPPEGLLRLPFAGAIFAMGLAVFFLVRRLAGARAAAVCAIASVSTTVVAQKVKLAEFDGILTAGVGIAVVAACYNLSNRRARLGIWVLGYLGLTAGFLAKGVPALMVYPAGVLAASWTARRLRRLLEWRHLAAASIFVLLAGGYLAGAYRSVGARAFEQPLAESKARGFGWLWQAPGDSGAPAAQETFVLPRDEAEISKQPFAVLARTAAKPALIFVAMLPWSLLVPFVFSTRSKRTDGSEAALLMRTAGAFLIAGTVVFMAVPTHAMRYYMPLSVAVGIVAGIRATRRLAFDGTRWKLEAKLAAALAFLAGAIIVAAAIAFESPPVTTAQRLTIAATGLITLAALLSAWRARMSSFVATAIVLTSICITVSGSLGFQVQREAKRNLRREARILASHVPDDEPVWVLGPSDLAGKNSSILFYLRRPVLAFRPGGVLPPDGSYCLLTGDRMAPFEKAEELDFEPIVTVEHLWRDFLLGRCFRRRASDSSSSALDSSPRRLEARAWNARALACSYSIPSRPKPSNSKRDHADFDEAQSPTNGFCPDGIRRSCPPAQKKGPSGTEGPRSASTI